MDGSTKGLRACNETHPFGSRPRPCCLRLGVLFPFLVRARMLTRFFWGGLLLCALTGIRDVTAQLPKRRVGKAATSQQPKAPATSQSKETSTPKQPASKGDNTLRPAAFQGITPGKSRSRDVKDKLGTPKKTDASDGIAQWIYPNIGPFQSVEVWIEQDMVTAVIAKLAKPASPDQLAKELKLTRFQPVEVSDGDEVLGRVYPERGVLFSYEPGKSEPYRVLQIALEPLTGEPFWLRAERADGGRYQQILSDLENARRFGWDKPELVWREIDVRMKMGDYDRAEELLGQLKADTVEQRLLVAELLVRTGKLSAAEQALQKLERDSNDPLHKARIEHLWGRRFSMGLDRDLPAAVEHQTKAVRLAKELLKQRDRSRRRAARRLLIDVHLSLAQHVAAGPFKDKTSVAVEWWREARKLVDDQPVFQRDLSLQHNVLCHILSADAMLEKPVLATPYVTRLKALAAQLLQQNDDPLFQATVRRRTAEGLFQAARIYRKLGRFEPALETAREARKMFAAASDRTESDEYTRGCLEFVLGSIYAVYQKDHAKACGYYDQALLLFDKPLPAGLGHETGTHGERFVSMGVSFWENGRKEKAVELTKRGALLMEQAVEHGLMPEAALAVPYGNLAAMQKALGNDAVSEDYSKKAAAISDKQPTRR